MKLARVEKSYSQQELADHVGVTRQIIGLIYIQYGTEDMDLFWNKIGITATILAIMAVVYEFFALIGYKKAVKEISD